MLVTINDAWWWFCTAFAVVLLTTLVMGSLSRHFYTCDVVIRKFTILELQWPGSPQELENLVKGLYRLPADRSAKAVSSLKKHLLIDFVFMPAAYGAVFLMCMQLSLKMTGLGHYFFAVLAWLQVLSFLMDIIENIYLWRKIKPGMSKPSASTYKTMQWLELAKWGPPMLAIICALSALLYYWLIGAYQKSSLWYVLVLAAEIAVFVIIGFIANSRQKDAS